ncbi:glycosyltransferase family 61 protein [Mesorhizobium australicum]|uniref:Glycosyltransferase family 61 protein n=1 Tax=Mesorhizobium australicum TaxID=536018 RepID=A0ACC6T4P3_9HYPH
MHNILGLVSRAREALLPALVEISPVDCRTFYQVDDLFQLLDRSIRFSDRVIIQEPERWVGATPHGLRTGTNVFGDGYAAPMMSTAKSETRMKSVASFACNRATLLPNTGAVITRDNKLIESTVENAHYFGGVEFVEPYLSRNGEGLLSSYQRDLKELDVDAIASFGVGSSNYGHFIFDGLQAAYIIYNILSTRSNVHIATQTLNSWQREFFSILGLEKRVVEIDRPTRFRSILGTTLASMHISYTTRFCRPLFDVLRANVAYREGSPKRLYVQRPPGSTRAMRNQEDVEDLLKSQGFLLVRPELFDVRQQIGLFSNAQIVVAQTGAALANIGFCPPGCQVVEIMPECYFDQWIRSTCYFLGHDWKVIFCKVPEASRYGLKAGGKEHPHADFDFSVDMAELRRALDAAKECLVPQRNQ